MERTLVVLAAGLSSRYGSVKQLDPLGPRGESLLDYAVCDAARAGFSKVICVVGPEMESDMQTHIRNGLCDVLPVECVLQRLDDCRADPGRFVGRQKPWGTGHAILIAADRIADPFVSVNADDFYGADSYLMLSEHCEACDDSAVPEFALVGFPLRDTLSRFGGVSRAICCCSEGGFLEELIEVTQIVATKSGSISGVTGSGEPYALTGDEVVSMNIWGFTPAVFPMLQDEFDRFQDSSDLGEDEFLASSALSALVDQGRARLKVLRARDTWFGITHPGDRTLARERLRALAARGVYPNPLYCRKDT